VATLGSSRPTPAIAQADRQWGVVTRSSIHSRLARLAGILLVLLLALPSTAWAGTRPKPIFTPPKHYYLSLGDSLGFGVQLNKLSALLDAGTHTPDAFNTGYTDDFARRMRRIRPDQQVENLSCPAETTDTMLDGGCGFTTGLGLALHVDYTGSQLDAAVAFLRAHRGQVSPITLSIGVADLLDADDCNLDPACIARHHVLAHIRQNLDQILTALQQAAPDAEFILLQQYDAYADTQPSSVEVWRQLNAVIGRVAAEHRARVADAFAAFNGTGRICELTFFCDEGDTHPTDAGYALLARLFFKASGYDHLLHDHH
jgi:lysophospholipase L1-like esterase